jgi:membrane-bound lytic murein transglycosylase D
MKFWKVISIVLCFIFTQNKTAQNHLSDSELSFIDRCDSLMVAHFSFLDSFTTDTNALNVYKYAEDSIPVFSENTIKERIRALDEKSPFDFLDNDVALAMVNLYVKKRYRLTSRMLGLSQLYFPLFEEKLSAYHLPMELKYLPIVESALNPTAVSRSGAGGLWQFMPATGRGYGLEVNSFIDQRYDPYLATEAACKYLSKLFAIYGDWSLALAAYNAGQGTVTKAIRRAGGQKDYWSIRPFLPKETQNYVPAFIAVNYVMNYASEHNIYPTKPHFYHYEMDTILVDQRVDMGVVEEWLDYNRVKLSYLNPMYLTEIIPADNSEKLPFKLPLTLVGKFISLQDSIYKYSSLDYKYWVANQKPARKEVIHIVKSGETLATLTEKYQCTEQDIKAWNVLSNLTIRTGKKLVMFQLVDGGKTMPSPNHYAKNTATIKENSESEPIKVSSNGEYKYHIVQKGDTLWNIAQKNKTSVDEIIKMNKHIDMNKLQTGTKLKIAMK